MDTNMIILIAVLIAQTLLMIFIISVATQTNRKVKQAEINNRLLTLLARKMNATEHEISEAWDV